MTVSELVDRYMEIKSCKLKENSLRAYGSAVNTIKESSGSKKNPNLKKFDAQMWFMQLHKQGLARNTIGVIKTVIQPAFELAVDDDAIRKNPFRFNISDLLADDAVYRDALTEAQQRKYLQFIKNYSNDNYYDDIVILVETGLRISELYGLTTSDVDLAKRRVLMCAGSYAEPETIHTSLQRRSQAVASARFPCQTAHMRPFVTHFHTGSRPRLR